MASTTQHRLALTFLSLSLVLLPLLIVPETSDPMVPVQMLGLSGLVFGFLAVLGVASVRLDWGPWPMRFWWGFIGWGSSAICISMVPIDAFVETGRLVVVTGFGLLCCWAIQALENPYKWLGRMCSVALIAVGGVGLAQHFGIGTGIPGFNGLPSGTLGNANFYGAALQMLIPGAVLGLRSSGPNRVLAITGLAVGGLGLFWSDSEAAWLGLGASILVTSAYLLPAVLGKPSGWRLRLRTWLLVGFAVAGLVVVVALGQKLMLETGNESIAMTQDSGRERLLLWNGSLGIIKTYPFWGCGPDNWNYAILEEGIVGSAQGFGTRYFMQAHNDYVQATAEYGILGGVLFLAFLGFAWVSGWRRQVRGESGDELWLSGLALGGLSGWMVNAGLSFPFHRPYLLMLLFVWLSVLGRGPQEARQGSKWLLGGTWALIGMAALAGMVWSGLKLKGDAANFKVLAAKGAMNFPEVARLSQEAQTWYNWEDGITKTPLTWFEGNALLSMGQQQAAFEPLLKAWRRNPWHPMVANNHAIALAMQGQMEEAISVMDRLLETFPEFDDTRVNLTRLYLATGKIEQAEATMRYWDGQNSLALVNQLRVELQAAKAGLPSIR